VRVYGVGRCRRAGKAYLGAFRFRIKQLATSTEKVKQIILVSSHE